jgi:hypothetical protein
MLNRSRKHTNTPDGTHVTLFSSCTVQSYLQSCLPGCRSVFTAASRSCGHAFYSPLRKHQYSIPLLVIISFSLLNVNYYVKPVCTGVSHSSTMTDGRSTAAKQMFSARFVQEPSFPTFLHACPLFGRHDNLPVLVLAALQEGVSKTLQYLRH